MLLRLEDVDKSYHADGKSVRALRGVTLAVDRGDFVAIRGRSGCGKSTLLLTAGALQRPDAGVVEIEGHAAYSLDAEGRAAVRAHSLGFVFQRFHLLPYLTVRDNVRAGGWALSDRAGDVDRRADELIERFDLGARAGHVPAELSTGERQRAALARALVNRPRILLADEPTGNLDDDNAHIVFRHLADFAADGGAVLLVTHDARAIRYARRVIPMTDGTLDAAAAGGAS